MILENVPDPQGIADTLYSQYKVARVIDPTLEFTEYLKVYLKKIPDNDSITDEDTGQRLITFKKIEQAQSFAQRFSPFSKKSLIAEPSKASEGYVTVDSVTFDRAVAVSHFLQRMNAVLFNPRIRERINKGVDKDGKQAETLNESDFQNLIQAGTVAVSFLYRTYIEDLRDKKDKTQLKERFQQAKTFFKKCSEDSLEMSNTKFRPLSATRWRSEFEARVVNELEAITILHQRMLLSPEVKDFCLRTAKMNEDAHEGTDCVAGVVTQSEDGTKHVYQIRYQFKHHYVDVSDNQPYVGLRTESGEKKVFLSEIFVGDVEVLYDPSHQRPISFYNLDQNVDKTLPHPTTEQDSKKYFHLFRNTIESLKDGGSWDVLLRAVNKDNQMNVDLFPDDKRFKNAQHILGWVMAHRKKV